MKRLRILLLALMLLAWTLPALPVRAVEPEMRIAVSDPDVLPGRKTRDL